MIPDKAGSTAPFHGDADANESQVGARQQALRLPGGGGGYQNVCTPPSAAVGAPAAGAAAVAAADPRVAELRRVGLPRIWITIAQTIGFDAFLAAWQILMQHGHVDDRNRIVVPNLQRYLRFQRNQLIRQLVAEGFGVDEVRERVAAATGENLSESHIRRAAQLPYNQACDRKPPSSTRASATESRPTTTSQFPLKLS